MNIVKRIVPICQPPEDHKKLKNTFYYLTPSSTYIDKSYDLRLLVQEMINNPEKWTKNEAELKLSQLYNRKKEVEQQGYLSNDNTFTAYTTNGGYFSMEKYQLQCLIKEIEGILNPELILNKLLEDNEINFKDSNLLQKIAEIKSSFNEIQLQIFLQENDENPKVKIEDLNVQLQEDLKNKMNKIDILEKIHVEIVNSKKQDFVKRFWENQKCFIGEE